MWCCLSVLIWQHQYSCFTGMLPADLSIDDHYSVRGQRQYEFAVEVTAGPPNSVFRHTKVITVKSKYIVENQTGMPIEIKQRGTPDLDVLQYGSTAHGRCARKMEVNER